MESNNIDLLELNSPEGEKEKKSDNEEKDNDNNINNKTIYENKYDFDNYKIIIKLIENNNKLLIVINEIGNKKYFHQYISNFESLKKLSVLFNIYHKIEDIYSVINKYLEASKIQIETEEEGIKFILKMVYPDLSIKNLIFHMTRVENIECNNSEIISNLIERIEKLEKKQKEFDSLTKFLNLSIDSLILTDSSQLIFLKEELTRQKQGKKYALKLLYRGTRDDDSNESFSSKCKGAKPLVFLIKTRKNLIFGGYMETEWKNDDLLTYDENAFMFSLDKMKIYKLKPGTSTQVGSNNTFMAYFSGGFQIKQNYFADVECKVFPLTGSNFDGLTEEYELNNGEQNFSVAEVEVFQVMEL